MAKTILLTSFRTWLPHQESNASDDLLAELAQRVSIDSSLISARLTFLRQLPVETQQASDRVIAKIEELHPDAIVCCGMAESRCKLTVESRATCGDTIIETPVNLEQLVLGLAETEISHDAGKFVCEGLYYSVLKHLNGCNLKCRCIFLHIPPLTAENSSRIIADCLSIIQRIL